MLVSSQLAPTHFKTCRAQIGWFLLVLGVCLNTSLLHSLILYPDVFLSHTYRFHVMPDQFSFKVNTFMQKELIKEQALLITASSRSRVLGSSLMISN